MSRRSHGPDGRVVIVSPHFDDAPLSLGQSLLDGDLSRREVLVVVVFSTSNWTIWFHPTPSRARVVSWVRRAEEAVAARRFGYRVRTLGFPELTLRSGATDSATMFDLTVDVGAEPFVPALRDAVLDVLEPGDEVWFPAGMGDHVDHRIVAEVGRQVRAAGRESVGFYEDRPYVSTMDDAQRAAVIARVGADLEPREVSGPVTEGLHRRLRSTYRSQIHDVFDDAMAADRAAAARERVWTSTT